MNKAEYNKAKKRLGFDPLIEKPGKLLSKKDLKLCFEIFKWKFGEKAKSSGWLNKNKYKWFVNQSIRKFSKWPNLIKAFGYEPLSVTRKLKSKEELIQEWREELYPKYGKKAKNCNWLNKNKYSWFVYQANRRFEKWSNFIKALGCQPFLRNLKSKEELIQEWREELYPKYGKKAKSCNWLNKNKYRWFVSQSTTRFGNWPNFIKAMGYEPLQRESKSEEELIQIWREELYPKFGEKAKNCIWLQNNECCWFVQQAIRRFGKWNNFIKALGYDPLQRELKSKEELKQIWKGKLYPKFGEKAKNCQWLINNKHGWFVAQSTTRFGKWTNLIKAFGYEPLQRELKSKEELKQIWKGKLYPKFGEKAKSGRWLKNNKYSWFVQQVTTRFGKWTNFIKALEGHFEITVEKMEIY